MDRSIYYGTSRASEGRGSSLTFGQNAKPRKDIRLQNISAS
jgi:hypothetical protein